MTKETIRDLAGKLGSVSHIPHHEVGTQEFAALHPIDGAESHSIAAARALAECGCSLLSAKRATEEAMDLGKAEITLPAVPSREDLERKVAEAGFRITFAS